MKQNDSNKETQESLIKRLTEKQVTYDKYERLKTAEGRRLEEFGKEEKKEKVK